MTPGGSSYLSTHPFFPPLRIQDEVKAVQRAESKSITTEYYLNSIQW